VRFKAQVLVRIVVVVVVVVVAGQFWEVSTTSE
jgi:hypothetical protein